MNNGPEKNHLIGGKNTTMKAAFSSTQEEKP